MPTSVATALFTAFILWSLIRDAKDSRGLSWSLWIPTLWVALISSKSIVYWINPDLNQQALFQNENGPPYDRFGFMALVVAGLITLLRRPIDWRALLLENRVLTIFYAYLLISVFWSDYTMTALQRYVKEIGNIVMILMILTERDYLSAIRAVFLRCAVVLIPMSVLYIKYYDSIGRYYNVWTGEGGICGVTGGKNQVGLLAMLSALILVWNLSSQASPARSALSPSGKLHHTIILLMALWILFSAHSATALACFLIGAMAFVTSRMRVFKDRPGILAFGGTVFLAASMCFFAIPDLRNLVAEGLGRHGDLTERTFVWQGCLSLDTNPLVGTGFFSFWLSPDAHRLGERLAVTEVHNGYLDTYLNLGAIGVVLLLLVLIRAARNVLDHIRIGSPLGPLFAAYVFVALYYNLTEAAFNDNNVVGFVLLLATICFPVPDPNARNRYLAPQSYRIPGSAPKPLAA